MDDFENEMANFILENCGTENLMQLAEGKTEIVFRHEKLEDLLNLHAKFFSDDSGVLVTMRKGYITFNLVDAYTKDAIKLIKRLLMFKLMESGRC